MRFCNTASHALVHWTCPHARNFFGMVGHVCGILQQVPGDAEVSPHASAPPTGRLHFAPFEQLPVQGVAASFVHSPEPRTASFLTRVTLAYVSLSQPQTGSPPNVCAETHLPSPEQPGSAQTKPLGQLGRFSEQSATGGGTAASSSGGGGGGSVVVVVVVGTVEVGAVASFEVFGLSKKSTELAPPQATKTNDTKKAGRARVFT